MAKIEKKVLILEGPNAIGKDSYINTILRFCPYYKVHYAASEIVNELRGQENLLPFTSYVTFDTILSSIKRDNSEYPHIQYRSPITSLIYNRIYRPDSPWLGEDEMYLERFLSNKYGKIFTLWIMTYEDDYLKSMYQDNPGILAERLRGRSKELYNLTRINDEYKAIAAKIQNKASNFEFVHTEGKGMADYFEALDSAIDKTVKIFGTYPLFLIDTEYFLENKGENPIILGDETRFIFLADDMDTFFKAINTSNFRYMPKENYAILFNSSAKVLNFDFFVIYAAKKIIEKRPGTKYATDSHSQFFIERR